MRSKPFAGWLRSRTSQLSGWARSACVATLTATLVACGGGSDGDPVPPPPVLVNTPPVASAGAAQSVVQGTAVTLDASASTDVDGDALTYAWTLSAQPAGSAATLSGPATVRPSFTPDRAGSYTLTLVVSDGRTSSTPATVSVMVAEGNAAPMAHVGAGQNVTVGSTVTLDGSASSDANGDGLTYRWSLTTRPVGSSAALASSTSARPSFAADVAGKFVATLIVNDGTLDSEPATVVVTSAAANVAPVARAGANQNVVIGGLALLDGSASADANSDALSYRWRLTTRPPESLATLSNATSAKPSFTADKAGDYVATLIVSDGLLDSEPATTIITAAAGNVAPSANAGPAQNVVTGRSVTLDGAASTDANGDTLAYSWALTTRPAGSAATLSSASTSQPTFIADRDGVYVATLVVTDGKLSSSPVTVTITAGPANVPPVANAGLGQAVTAASTVTLDASASADANGDALSYAWSLTSRPSGSTAALSSAIALRPTFVADKEGTYVATLVVNDGKAASAPATVTVTAIPADAPVIVIDRSEPLSGAVQLSLSKAVAGTVTWFVDLRQIGVAPSVSWTTTGVSNGSHLLVARVQSGTDSAYEIRRTVTVSNSSITVATQVSGTTGIIAVDAIPSSPFGITRVTATFDGEPAGSLTAPNACGSRFGCTTNNAYRFNVDAAIARSGNHTMVFAVTDGSGATQTASVPVPVNNPPQLGLTTPTDGGFVFGTLSVSGTTSTDKTGAVTVTARLGDVQFLQTTNPSLSANYDLTGVAPGSYLLTVRATDATNLSTQVQRTVVVTSMASMAHQPVFMLPTGGQLLAAEDTRVLYDAGGGAVRLRDLVSGTEVALQGAAGMQYATDWQVMGGRAYVQARDSDCSRSTCIYEWSATGLRRNLSMMSPHTSGSSYQVNPVARDGFVIWTNWSGPNPGSYTVFDVARETFTRVLQPVGANYLGNTDYDFAVVDGVLQFPYWAQTGGEGTASTFDVFKWRSDTGSSVRLTSASGRSIYTQTDGVRAAWQQTPVGGTSDNTFTLVTQPLAGTTTTAVSTTATRFLLRGGVLAWAESASGGARAIKASTTTAAFTLSSLSSSTLLANAEGRVAFSEQGRVYTFDAATGRTTLRVETVPTGTAFISGGALVFTVQGAVYRVVLD